MHCLARPLCDVDALQSHVHADAGAQPGLLVWQAFQHTPFHLSHALLELGDPSLHALLNLEEKKIHIRPFNYGYLRTVIGPKIWTSLHLSVRSKSTPIFKSALKIVPFLLEYLRT